MTAAPRHGVLQSLVMVGSGGVTAIVPAAVQAVSARTFPLDGQAQIAAILSVGSFCAGVVAAALLEPRMADLRLTDKTYVPWWSTFLGLAGCLLLFAAPTSIVAMCFGIPAAMVTLQIGRMHAAYTAGWRVEVVTASALLLGSVSSVVIAQNGSPWGISILGASMAIAISVRSIKAPRRASGHPRLAPTVWISLETAMVALVPLAIVWTAFLVGRNDEAVALKAVLTVLGVLQPILGYMRTRLLGVHSVGLTATMSVLSVMAMLAVLALDVAGVFGHLFGSSWGVVGLSALAVACLWKLVSIPTTLPFTRLRRAGFVGEVFWVRIVSSVLYLVISVVLLLATSSLVYLFVGLTLAEGLTGALLFWRSRSLLGSVDRSKKRGRHVAEKTPRRVRSRS